MSSVPSIERLLSFFPSHFKSGVFHSGRPRVELESVLGGTLGGVFLKFYEQIVAGVWSVLLILPVETFAFRIDGIKSSSGYLTHRYAIGFGAFTAFFLLSSFFLPIVRKFQLRKIMSSCLSCFKGNEEECSKFLKEVENSILCREFFTKNGMWRFSITIFVNIATSACFFAIENSIAYFNDSYPSLLPSAFFSGIFILSTTTAKLLGVYGRRGRRKKMISSDLASKNRPSTEEVDSLDNVLPEEEEDESFAVRLSSLAKAGAISSFDEVGDMAMKESMVSVVRLVCARAKVNVASKTQVNG